MKNILITGCSGLLGSSLTQTLKKNYQAYDIGVDITDGNAVKNVALK